VTYPDYADLDPSEWELEQLAEVEAEVEAEGYGGDEPDDGSWHNVATRLGEIGAQVDDTYARNATRIGEDIVAAIERRPKDEQRLASAMRRIEAGTYTEPEFFRGEAAAAAARDPFGRYAAACGAIDDYGRCASRYHAPSCHTVTEGAAATSTPEAVNAWNDVLSGYTPPAGLSGWPARLRPSRGAGTTPGPICCITRSRAGTPTSEHGFFTGWARLTSLPPPRGRTCHR
jgi:hypothetical protein